jgi:hypothetical protein
MGFGNDDLNDGQRELLDELTEAQAGSVIRILMGKYGYVGTYFQRGDVDSVLDRVITDEEWDKVQDSWYWYRGIPDSMADRGYDLVREAVNEVGLLYGEGEDEDDD